MNSANFACCEFSEVRIAPVQHLCAALAEIGFLLVLSDRPWLPHNTPRTCHSLRRLLAELGAGLPIRVPALRLLPTRTGGASSEFLAAFGPRPFTVLLPNVVQPVTPVRRREVRLKQSQ